MASRLLILLLMTAILVPLRASAELPPQFSGTDVRSGATIDLRDYRGKVVLVDFWASWCPPCLESLPAWEQFRQSYGAERFEVIAINVDENPADGLAFLEKTPVSFPVLSDPEGTIGKPWGIRSLPRYFLLDQGGNVVKSYRRFRIGDEDDVRRAIEALLD